MDLKPALDGFAGIPQECRMLFSMLLKMTDYADIDGLLQHGTGYYPRIDQKGATGADDILPVSDFLSVLRTGIERFYIPRAPIWAQRRIANQHLRLMSYTNTELKLGRFQTADFDDLIWHALFGKAIKLQDMETVCRARFRPLEIPRQLMQNIALEGIQIFPAKKYLRVDTSDYDIFVSQSPFPGRLSSNTKMIVRYHDSVPIFMPHTIGDQAIHKAMHFKALKSNVADGAWFSCVSEASRMDLLKIFPEVEDRSFVIHNTVLEDYGPAGTQKEEAWNVVSTYLSSEHEDVLSASSIEVEQAKEAGDDYVLMVSTLEPRKNHELLISAFHEYRQKSGRNIKLVLVGSKGWNCDSIVRKVAGGIARGSIFHLTGVPTSHLKKLYTHASATVCPSFFEGFDYSGVEAMRCGGYLIASDIPVHREVFGDGASYFDAYSSSSVVSVLQQALDPVSENAVVAQKKKALKISEKYSTDVLRERWRTQLDAVLSSST